MKKLPIDTINNRLFFLQELRSGKYKKGTIKSDESGNPVIESKEDDNGYCACAIMAHMFGQNGNKVSLSKAVKALGITNAKCQYIQREINDTPLGFPEIADRIENEIFSDVL